MNIFLNILLLVATIIFLIKDKKTESILLVVGQSITLLISILSWFIPYYGVARWIGTLGFIIFIIGFFILAFNTKKKY